MKVCVQTRGPWGIAAACALVAVFWTVQRAATAIAAV